MSVFVAQPAHGAAWVTGASSGIGRAVALELARLGFTVVATARSADKLSELGEETNALKGHVVPMPGDVTDPKDMARIVDTIERQHDRLALAVFNAGVYLPVHGEALDVEDFHQTFAVNLGGVVNGVMTLLPRMLAHGEESHFVTTSSTAGFSAVGGAGIYCTAKYAVAGLMETLATDVKGTNVGVSVYFPGPVETAINSSTHETRPAHLKNEAPPPAMVGERDRRPPPNYDMSLFMSKEEVGKRVLRGIQRGDLFIMSHPEFREGIVARNEALLRAIPDEPVNEPRKALVSQFGTLMYNPIYDTQKKVPGEKF